MKLKMKPKKWPQPENATKSEDRKRLMAKSLLCFGRSNHYKSMMKRGRFSPDPLDGRPVYNPISLQEIEDTMDYILKSREEIQNERSEETGSEQTENGASTTGSATGSGQSDDVRSEEV